MKTTATGFSFVCAVSRRGFVAARSSRLRHQFAQRRATRRCWLLQPEPLKRPAEHVAQPWTQLLVVNVLAGNDFRLQRFGLHLGERGNLPDKDFRRLPDNFIRAAQIVMVTAMAISRYRRAAMLRPSTLRRVCGRFVIDGADGQRTGCVLGGIHSIFPFAMEMELTDCREYA